MATNTTLVINSKGGSGKTTITTNLASYFASRQVPTTILDYDAQGSSLNWLSLRDRSGTRLYGANAAPQRGARIRSIEMHVPANTRQLLIDAPAGASGLLLQEMLSRANCIVIPVAPSAFDIYATANFVKDRLCGELRSLRRVRPIVRHHHEHLDGTGYPDGLHGGAISLLAQIMSVVDVFDALTTARPYKPAFSVAVAY